MKKERAYVNWEDLKEKDLKNILATFEKDNAAQLGRDEGYLSAIEPLLEKSQLGYLFQAILKVNKNAKTSVGDTFKTLIIITDALKEGIIKIENTLNELQISLETINLRLKRIEDEFGYKDANK